MLFLMLMEWIPNILLLVYFGEVDVLSIVKLACLHYLAFISLYEIGYYQNDTYSVNKETAPRNRGQNGTGNIYSYLFILVRVFTFLGVTYHLQYFDQPIWWLFYCLLAFSFIGHNVISQYALRVFTFWNLASFRFFAISFMILKPEQLLIVAPTIMLCYVLYRSISYMDSKALINIPSRETFSFKFSFYTLLLPTSLCVAGLFQDFLPIILHLYYILVFVGHYLLANMSKKR